MSLRGRLGYTVRRIIIRVIRVDTCNMYFSFIQVEVVPDELLQI